MHFSDDSRVQALLEDLQSTAPEKLEMVLLIRALFQSANTALTEGVKYGGLVYFLNDALISGIFVYQKHISIEFSDGANFSDSNGWLEGSGKFRRHLKIVNAQDIEGKQASEYIAQAVKG